MISFTIPISPQPKLRPRFTRRGRAYTPAKTVAFERAVRIAASRHKPSAPLTGPLEVTLYFDMPKPKRLPKGRVDPTVKPDLDNLVKAVTDALNGMFWVDDAQIVRLDAVKFYAKDAASVGVYVQIEHEEIKGKGNT